MSNTIKFIFTILISFSFLFNCKGQTIKLLKTYKGRNDYFFRADYFESTKKMTESELIGTSRSFIEKNSLKADEHIMYFMINNESFAVVKRKRQFGGIDTLFVTHYDDHDLFIKNCKTNDCLEPYMEKAVLDLSSNRKVIGNWVCYSNPLYKTTTILLDTVTIIYYCHYWSFDTSFFSSSKIEKLAENHFVLKYKERSNPLSEEPLKDNLNHLKINEFGDLVIYNKDDESSNTFLSVQRSAFKNN